MLQILNFKYATKTAIAATFTSAIFMYFHYKNPQWAVMSTLLTMQSCANSECFESTLIAGFTRAVGATIGILIGLGGYWLMNEVASDGFLWVILVVIFMSLWLAVLVNQKFKSLQLIPACTIMVITMSLVDAAPLVAYDRAFEVLSGVFIALSFNFIFCPYRQNKQLEKTFYEVINLCHKYYSHSISKISAVEASPTKPTQKTIKQSLIKLNNIKSSKLTFFTDQNLLSQQEAIQNAADQLVNSIFELNKRTNDMKSIKTSPETQKIISIITEDIDIKFKRISSNKEIFTDNNNGALNQLLQNKIQKHDDDIKLIILLHSLDELFNVIIEIDNICAAKKHKK